MNAPMTFSTEAENVPFEVYMLPKKIRQQARDKGYILPPRKMCKPSRAAKRQQSLR